VYDFGLIVQYTLKLEF